MQYESDTYEREKQHERAEKAGGSVRSSKRHHRGDYSPRYTQRVKSVNLSSRASQIAPSPTLAVAARARELKAQGIDVISLAAGEPDFATPAPVCEAAIAALKSGYTKYTPTAGIGELRAAIAEKLQRDNGVPSSPGQVVVSCGAKQAVFGALFSLLDPGDEVILFAPYWPTYTEQIRLAGGIPRVVRCSSEAGFLPDFEAVSEAVNARTKAILLNSPCNPTGAVFPRQTLERIALLSEQHGLWIISDEIYEKLYFGERPLSPASLGEQVAGRTVTIGGCSKSYSMTGWRIGYSSSPPAVAQAICALQDQVNGNATSFAQYGALAALNLPEDDVALMREEFRVRRDLALLEVASIDGMSCHPPSGAFYLLIDVRSLLTPRFDSDVAFCEWLIEEARVATVPGSAFDAPGFLRLSFATSREELTEAFARIRDAVESLKVPQ